MYPSSKSDDCCPARGKTKAYGKPSILEHFASRRLHDCTTATPSWIEEQLRNGKLPYRWIGNKRVIFRRDPDELMESLPVETGLCDVPAFMEKSQKGKAAA